MNTRDIIDRESNRELLQFQFHCDITPVAWQLPSPLSSLQDRRGPRYPRTALGSARDPCPPAARAETKTDAERRTEERVNGVHVCDLMCRAQNVS